MVTLAAATGTFMFACQLSVTRFRAIFDENLVVVICFEVTSYFCDYMATRTGDATIHDFFAFLCTIFIAFFIAHVPTRQKTRTFSLTQFPVWWFKTVHFNFVVTIWYYLFHLFFTWLTRIATSFFAFVTAIQNFLAAFLALYILGIYAATHVEHVTAGARLAHWC